MKTLKQLAQDALDVQSACNLSGVAHGYSRAMTDLGEHVSGTDAKNSHPIAVLWADKIASLTGIQDIGNDTAMKAYDWAYAEIAKVDVVSNFMQDHIIVRVVR